MATEQGGASAWRADSNLCMHFAIEVNGGNCVLSCWSTVLDWWQAGRDQSRVQGSRVQMLSEDVKRVMYVYYVKWALKKGKITNVELEIIKKIRKIFVL